ncbi:ASCH domain-containing protein [Acidilobus sp.]|uniref:ASCH domain-containing protein n=1 Tax=Acidilobus sp. TaxID=1872109 RepID=UPI003D08423A
MLTVKKKYLKLILSGRKTSTIRLGNLQVRGRYLKVVTSGRPVAVVRVEEVIHKKVKDLTDEDAELDGFSGLAELFRELRSIYGDFMLDDDITIIRFSLVRTIEGSEAGRSRETLGNRAPAHGVDVSRAGSQSRIKRAERR